MGKGDCNYQYEDKMCYLSSIRDQIDARLLKQLIKDSRYLCRACGRSAVNSQNLCSPKKL